MGADQFNLLSNITPTYLYESTLSISNSSGYIYLTCVRLHILNDLF